MRAERIIVQIVSSMAVLLVCSPFAGGEAGDGFEGHWPNWRGPDYNGISAETDWLATWPEGGPKVLWKASVGTGFSSIAVSDGR